MLPSGLQAAHASTGKEANVATADVDYIVQPCWSCELLAMLALTQLLLCLLIAGETAVA